MEFFVICSFTRNHLTLWYTFGRYKNPLLDYKLCVCPAFFFLSKYLLFTPNPVHYTPKSPFSSTNHQLFRSKSSYGCVLVSAVPSVHCGGWGVLHAQSALRETSGRGGFKWVILRRCAQNYIGAINLLRQSQYRTQLPVWLPGL